MTDQTRGGRGPSIERPCEGPLNVSRDYLEAKRLARQIASDVGRPRFYTDRGKEVSASRASFRNHPCVRTAIGILRRQPDHFGHGLLHAARVAVDAGAIVLIEMNRRLPEEERQGALLLIHLAGILHDIRRSEQRHAMKSAEAAAQILRTFGLTDPEREAVAKAIGNHEAFQPVEELRDPLARLLSDALYDADKFRWGPDNFTEMLWAMLTMRRVPLSRVMGRFLEGLQGIERIRTTFRSEAGQRYGPDFIDRGMEIGRRLYEELVKTEPGRAAT